MKTDFHAVDGPITGVRPSRHACFDRLVIDLKGAATSVIQALDPPLTIDVPENVESWKCTMEVELCWQAEQGSALDTAYLASLGQFDIVYSWGVLHHTGNLTQALSNVAGLVREGGVLFIAIYNDTGSQAARWKWVKRKYNELPRPLRLPFAVAVIAPSEAKDLLRASQTHLLDEDDPHVAENLKRIKKGKKLSPVLLIRGNAAAGVTLLAGSVLVLLSTMALLPCVCTPAAALIDVVLCTIWQNAIFTWLLPTVVMPTALLSNTELNVP